MKLTLIMCFVFSLGLSALTYSQKTELTLNLKNSRLEDVFNEIREQSEFSFWYKDNEIDLNKAITVQVTKQNIESVLKQVLKDQDISYMIFDKHIVIYKNGSNNRSESVIYQQQKITGTVTDATTGEPIVGANIIIEGTTIGVISDTNGNYSIDVPGLNSVLVVSFVGYNSEKVALSGKIQIDIKLIPDIKSLEEVVVIGYGTKSKETLTGAISIIDDDVLDSRPAAKTTDLLQGISSGLQITRNNTGDIRGSSNGITIRGVTSRSAPGVLVVIDGIAQANTDSKALDNINPNDIESISILKDGQAAIYGARAAGGVILVTTKQGKAGKPTISFSANSTLQKPSLMRQTLNVLDLSEMQNEGFVNDGQITNPYSPVIKYIADNNITFEEVKKNNGKHIVTAPFDLPYALGHYDWNDIMFNPSLQQNYDMSISGSNDKFTYYESVDFLDQDGMLAYGENYKKRLLGTLKNDYQVNKFLKIRSNLNIGSQKIVEPFNYSSNTYNGGVQGALFFVWPTNQPYTKGGHYFNMGGYHDPIGYAQSAGNRTDLSYILHGNLGAEVTPFKNFLITAEIASNYDILESNYASIGFPMYNVYDEFTQYSSDDNNTGPNKAGADFIRSRYTIGNLYAKYSFEKLENHKINIMAGYSHEENDYRSFSAYRLLGLISDQLPTMSAGSGDEQYNSEVKNDYALNSVYSRLEYSFKNRYLLDGVFRYDGSSKFAEGYRWVPFYGFSGAWIISEEKFMGKLKSVIDFLKVRATWGELGNQSGINLYDYLSQINIGGAYPMGSYTSPSQSQSATLGGMASTTRSWEIIESKNLGVDFRTFNSKLTGSFDIFVKDNKDMFFNQEFPQVLGTTAPSINGAHLRTKGWEMEIGWRDKINQLDYSLRLSISDNHNKVMNLADAILPVQGTNNYIQGYPALSYFGYDYDGLIQTESELQEYKSSFSSGIPNNITVGDARFKDLDGDNKLEALPYSVDANGDPTSTSGDLVQIGDGGQHYLYGISLGLSWRNFDFSSFFQGVLKWQVISTVRPASLYYEPIESYFYHQTWSPERTDAMWPRLSQNSAVKGYNYQYSNAPYKLFNNRYIRLKNIQIGYTLPKSFTNRIHIDKLRVYLSGTDIWEFSNLPGKQDPETPFATRLSPFPRQYSFGLNLTF